jgi:hypothetical protein
MPRGDTDGKKSSRMDHFPPQKRGGKRRQDETWEGNKAYGGGRWSGTPLGIELTGEAPHESTLIEKTLGTIRVPHVWEEGDQENAFRD